MVLHFNPANERMLGGGGADGGERIRRNELLHCAVSYKLEKLRID